jgi:alkylated DNA repair protein (DNA oxidative demethylase)
MAEGAVLLRGYAKPLEADLIVDISDIVAQAPFRHMVTPGGHAMSVAMTNCGGAGWVTDRTGYRYDANDPEAGRPWPVMPPSFRALAGQAAAEAGFLNFSPDACLINRYQPGARMSLHQDKDEHDFGAPIVSVSLGLSAVFLFGGLRSKRQTAALPAAAWRHRGMGRPGTAQVSRCRAARGRRARVDGPATHQSDF